ncbi:MAG: hypothetical protein AAGK97_10295 [Bacteroidota bacterium]
MNCIFILFPIILNWNTFEAEKSNFQVLVPAPMKYTQQVIPSEVGEIESNTYYLEFEEKDAKNYLFLINHLKYPLEMVHSDSMALTQELLEETETQLLIENNASLIYTDTRFYYNYPGRFLRMENETSVIKTQMFIIENNLYCLQVYMLKEHSMNQNAKKFLKSFALLN